MSANPSIRESTLTETRSEQKLQRPRMWRVLLHNDDYTTQEFVVWVLETIFHKPHGEAFSIMMSVHRSGLGIAGVFTRDVADTKVQEDAAAGRGARVPAARDDGARTGEREVSNRPNRNLASPPFRSRPKRSRRSSAPSAWRPSGVTTPCRSSTCCARLPTSSTGGTCWRCAASISTRSGGRWTRCWRRRSRRFRLRTVRA